MGQCACAAPPGGRGVREKFRCGLFKVAKDSQFDRQILNPIPENGRTYCPNDETRSLAHASLFSGIFIPEGYVLLISSDDLEDFYHEWLVSDIHKASNHVQGVFAGRDSQGFNAYDPDLDGLDVVGAFWHPRVDWRWMYCCGSNNVTTALWLFAEACAALL